MKNLIKKILKESEDWDWVETSWEDDINELFNNPRMLEGKRFSVMGRKTGELMGLNYGHPKPYDGIFVFTELPSDRSIGIKWLGFDGIKKDEVGTDYFKYLFLGKTPSNYAFFVDDNREPLWRLVNPLWKNKLKAYYNTRDELGFK
jgi:hypothetical protein